jgi:hypothetical protein
MMRQIPQSAIRMVEAVTPFAANSRLIPGELKPGPSFIRKRPNNFDAASTHEDSSILPSGKQQISSLASIDGYRRVV